MRYKIRVTTAAVLLIAATAIAIAGCGSSSKSSSSSATTTTATPPAKSFSPATQAKLRQAVQSFVGPGKFPGMVVAVLSPQGSFTYATGYSDLAGHTPMSTSNVLRIGSITKTFTATVILQLVQQGKLSLNDALSKYEPQIPHASSITIRELLNHTSGLQHGSPGKSYFQHPQQSPSPQQVIATTAAKPLLSPPGRAYHYSDVGYLILGEVAQKVTGTDIGTLIQRQILSPLGLHHTAYAPGTSIASPAAHGYVTQHGKQSDTTNWNYAYAGSAGSMASTLSDLEVWGPALATGNGILSPAMQRQRLSGMVNVTGAAGVTYGLGVFEVGGFLGHDGEVPGYNSVVLYSPQKKETAIVLGNTSPIVNIPAQPNLESFPNMLTALSQALGAAG